MVKVQIVPRRVLVVDDDADARLMVRLRLQLAGFDVHEAAGALAAVAWPRCSRLSSSGSTRWNAK